MLPRKFKCHLGGWPAFTGKRKSLVGLLVAQWLTFCTCNAGGAGRIPHWGTKSRYAIPYVAKYTKGGKKEISYNCDSLCVKNWSPILTPRSEAVVILSKGLEPGTLFYSIPLIN